MNNDYSHIITKARELSSLLKAHPITKRYEESLEKMKQDHKAQDLLARLVMAGRDLSEQARQGGGASLEHSSENALLEEEFQNNELVKEHILIQKEYLEMVAQMQDHMRNPRNGEKEE